MKKAMDDYLESLKIRHFSPDTIESRSHVLRRFFAYLDTIGMTDLRAVSPDTIADYQRNLLGAYQVASARVHLAGLRHFFAHLENRDAVLLDPCLGVPLPKEEKTLPRPILTPWEVSKLLNAPDATPKGLRDRAIMELFYASAIRLAEMARLKLADVDIKNGFLRVNKGKGGRDRVVPIGQAACGALGEYLKKARAPWCKIKRDPTWTDALWLWPTQPHGPIGKQAIALIVQRYAKRVLGRNVSPHLWRHTCATQMVSNGANVAYVQRLLGHKSLKTTDIYTRVCACDLKKTIKRHPRSRMKNAPPAALTPEAVAQMPGGHRHHLPPTLKKTHGNPLE